VEHHDDLIIHVAYGGRNNLINVWAHKILNQDDALDRIHCVREQHNLVNPCARSGKLKPVG
jgi:hypothetical protein